MHDSYPLSGPVPVSATDVETRATFIVKSYQHLLGAVLGFAALEVVIFRSGLAEPIASAMLSVSWLAVLGAFIVVSWLASRVAHRAESLGVQYAALVGFVLAEAILFVPLLYIVQLQVPGGIQSAALVTLIGFLGLTWVAFATRKDFSFLGGILKWAMVCALVLIVAGVIFGFQLGTFFSVAMIGLAGGAILYDTSNILHHYPRDRYVAAALELFASIALMFWYVLRLFLSRD
ncbi:MAG: Bax inhibitor-1 family protein [Acidobacteriota bacterium]